MKYILLLTFVSVAAGFTSFKKDKSWVPLLDKNLSKWEIYQSYRHTDDFNGKVPVNAKGDTIAPIGFNKNEANLATLKMINNEPVLRISGEIYGCVYTRQEFANYHLKLMVKFGDKKWIPRTTKPKDSGLLYHSKGKPGVDYWLSWMQAQEFQIMEGGFGDYWCVAATGALIKMHNPESNNDMGIYDPKGKPTQMGLNGTRTGFVQHSADYEKPGEWNSIELICFGDKSVHIINGHVVLATSKMISKENGEVRPLTSGRIQLQSEAAEVFYKDIQIKKLDSVPAEYVAYFK